MAKISFGKTVKYQGSVYPPNTVFEVSDSDVADLQKAGGWVIEESKAKKEKVEPVILAEEIEVKIEPKQSKKPITDNKAQ